MKNTFKFFLVICSFLFFLFIFDRVLGFGLDKLYFGQQNELTYAQNDCNDDMIILGSSRASHHYISTIISDSLGLTCVNLGKDGQNIFYHYAILNTILAHHTPKILIYELYDIDFQETISKYDKEQLNILTPLYDYNQTVRDVVDLKGKRNEIVLELLKTYKYNSMLSTIIKGHIKRDFLDNAGYYPVYGFWNKEIELKKHTPIIYSKEKISYIQKIIDICKQKGIKLVVTVSPRFYINNDNETYPIKRIVNNAGFDFWNFEQDSILLSDKRNFKDIGHLNDSGALIYTKMIVKRLKTLSIKD